MKKIFIYSLPLFVIAVVAWGITTYVNSLSYKLNPKETQRTIVQVPLSVAENSSTTVEASKLPEFTFDLSDQKFQRIIAAGKNELDKFAEVTIVHSAFAEEKLAAEINIDKEKSELVIHPKDLPNFKPGKYRLHLTLRTIDGIVNVDQDFSWGVIAVNTNKSIYKPGDAALISMGVLNDRGETQCMTGEQSAKVWVTITGPNGVKKEYSTEDKSIRDSEECSAVSVTNNADFQALFLVENPGVHQMKVVAEIKGERREVEDYFTVENQTAFAVERYSFPTRIYPRAAYNVVFTVTSAADYTGTVEEIVPENFRISNINENGKEEKSGEFKKLIWNVTLKKGEKKEFKYRIHFPLISPEFYLLGPIKIGDFAEARQWQIASDAINSTSGLVAYEDNGGSNTWSRIWTGAPSGTYPQGWNPDPPTAATSMSTVPGDGRWFVEKSSPKTGEKILALVDNVGPDRLIVFTWNGTSWGGAPSINIALGSSTADVTRPVDVAYEEESGDAIVVYSDYSTNQLRFYKRVSGVWDGSSSTAGTAYDVYKRWVRLEPQAGSDTILVGYLNNNERVGGMIWDGSTNTFGNQFADDVGSATATSDEQAFDIAWETQSGTPMVFWGTTGNNLVYREFTSGSWQAEATAASGFTNDLDWVFVATDPVSSSNNIALGLQDGTACVVRFGIWTGASATMNGTTATCPSATTNNLVDTAFENSTGKAMWVYITSAASSQMSWLTWTSGGGFTSGTAETGTSTNIEGIQLHTDLNTTSMLALYHDNSGTSSNCQLWDRQWDGSAWSAKDASPVHANLCASADNDTLPYGFGFDRNLETMAAYRWFSANNGTSVSSALTTQDTPYTLTQANQQFRLRLLLYYPDSLATSGRDYKLQFVDPGTGTCANPTGGTPSTWTDVPTSGSEISFYNNATPADGDNLTENVSLDPTYGSYTRIEQDYEESNNFTNSVSAMSGDQVGEWDFSLVDNTTYDRTAQSFCFRVTRSNNLVLQIAKYPQINTAAISDVLIQGGSLIQGGTRLQ